MSRAEELARQAATTFPGTREGWAEEAEKLERIADSFREEGNAAVASYYDGRAAQARRFRDAFPVDPAEGLLRAARAALLELDRLHGCAATRKALADAIEAATGEEVARG